MDDSQSVNWTAIDEMAAALTPDQRDQAEWRIRNAGKVHMDEFKVAIAVLFAMASMAFIGRIAIRLSSRRRMYLDDLILTIGYLSLIGATFIFYERARVLYLVFGLTRKDTEITLIASQEIETVYNQLNWSFGYTTTLWTAIFSVKICYFVFFRALIQSMPVRLVRYYWVAIILTLLAWIYLVLQPLISCPYFGASSSKCFPRLPISDAVMNFTFWTGPIFDALTDAALVSIPIIVLRKSQMALLTKIGLGVFLCLSLVMIACSIIRAAGTYYGGTLDTPWQVFWLHAEACIGVLMASITVYRSVLLGPSNRPGSLQRFLVQIIRARSAEGRSSEGRSSEGLLEAERLSKRARFGRLLLSKIPTATLTGIVTLFAQTEDNPETSNSISTIYSEDYADYHMHLKNSQAVGYAKTSPNEAGRPQKGSPPRRAMRNHYTCHVPT
ncbi:hypothetical protein F4803DRAFT_544387 [Xylaria telfairii]|nr:hypothetical protein F4803DRAFT_544387 [Xylaria telfairii]